MPLLRAVLLEAAEGGQLYDGSVDASKLRPRADRGEGEASAACLDYLGESVDAFDVLFAVQIDPFFQLLVLPVAPLGGREGSPLH